MSTLAAFNKLDQAQRRLVALAVLLDGFDAIEHLRHDAQHGATLAAVARDLATLPPALRMQFLATVLRQPFGDN